MNVYLVDDDDIFNTLHEAVIRLSCPDARISIFKTGEEVLQHVRNLSDAANAPNLLFLDIRMPDMDGFSFLEAIKKDNPAALHQTEVFMLSSTLNEKDLERAKKFTMVREFISKPLMDEDFRRICMMYKKNN